MIINIEAWQMASLILTLGGMYAGSVFVGFRLLMGQIEKRLDERFVAAEETRKAGSVHWDGKFGAIETAMREDASHWMRLEREILGLKAELPVNYVRREDYIRNQTIIEAKLDTVAAKIENLRLREAKHD
ncbi:MAG: hypothetical protein PHU46_12120 [Rhodocyclaceae bacterium]|nr:hypothetical protein [Rhodocyclaceae bacterium]